MEMYNDKHHRYILQYFYVYSMYIRNAIFLVIFGVTRVRFHATVRQD